MPTGPAPSRPSACSTPCAIAVPGLSNIIQNALPGLALATGILMVSRVKYAHVVNRVLKGRRPFITLIELALVIALFFLFREFAFFIAFFGYAITGPLFWIKKRVFRKPAVAGQSPEERHENLF